MHPQDRHVVVTGAAHGIGSALVEELVAHGARTVVATDLDEKALAANLARWESLTAEGSTTVLTRRLDVSDEGATADLVTDLTESHGPIDLWFANAGISGSQGVGTSEIWDRQISVNLLAHAHAVRALLPGWLERSSGHFVSTASMAGLLTSLGDGVYSATKHAALGFAEWLSITYGHHGVEVSCVCPGAVDTPMLRGFTEAGPDRAADIIGGGDVMSAADAATAIVAGVIAGQTLILTHPDMQRFVQQKGTDHERWITGMRRLWARTESLIDQPT